MAAFNGSLNGYLFIESQKAYKTESQKEKRLSESNFVIGELFGVVESSDQVSNRLLPKVSNYKSANCGKSVFAEQSCSQ